MRLHLDYETRSAADLINGGQYSYAEHRSTQVILAAWAIDHEPFRVWRILEGESIPFELRLALADPTVTIVAHNAAFERIISTVVNTRQKFLPDYVWDAMRPVERWSCTAIRAAACGLPRALEKAGKALFLEHQKDKEGHALMLEMCAPRGIDMAGRYVWAEGEIRMNRLALYCINDGLAERDIDDALPELSPFEQKVCWTTERMNDRGVRVDQELLLRLMVFVRDATNYLNDRISDLTNGAVPKVTTPKRIIQWLKDEHGIDTEDNKIGKWIIAGLLEDEDIPAIVREVLVLRRDGGKSSTAKFTTLMKRINFDSRIRGTLLYAGAQATRRFSSRGAQLHNLPRGKVLKNPEGAIKAILGSSAATVSTAPSIVSGSVARHGLVTLTDIERDFGPPMVVASELARPVFIAKEHHWLARGDYSQIEARIIAWLAGEQQLLDAFRAYDAGTGPDLYIVTASQIFGLNAGAIDANDPRRQVGKVTILSCGYQGGVSALSAMCKIYGVKLTDGQKEFAKNTWREANPNIVSFWYDMNRAAIECMKDDVGRIHQARSGIWFRRNEHCLVMRLPSGEHLFFWYPLLEEKMMPWDEMGLAITYTGEDSQKHIWRRYSFYGGLAAAMATQSTARDIMAYALVNLEEKGRRPVLTVHDEALCELPKSIYPVAKDAAEAVKQDMLEMPAWAYGLPVAADASAADRYIKV